MIYATGDTHSDVSRLSVETFPEQREMTKDDYVVILGDFGLVWDCNGETKNEKYWLDWLDDKPFTTLFVDGNHENFHRLYKYPVKDWHGGRVHEVRPNVLHLMRGEVFDIDGATCFAFGGAPSHDIAGLATDDELDADYTAGILDPEADGYGKKLKKLKRMNRDDPVYHPYRVKNRSWWAEEIASEEEMAYGLENLRAHGNKADFIFTHDGPASTVALGWMGAYKPNPQSLYLEKVRSETDYKVWLFGHYHENRRLDDNAICLYEQITRIW